MFEDLISENDIEGPRCPWKVTDLIDCSYVAISEQRFELSAGFTAMLAAAFVEYVATHSVETFAPQCGYQCAVSATVIQNIQLSRMRKATNVFQKVRIVLIHGQFISGIASKCSSLA